MFKLYYFEPETWRNGYFYVDKFETEELAHEAAVTIQYYRIEHNLGWGARIVYQSEVVPEPIFA